MNLKSSARIHVFSAFSLFERDFIIGLKHKSFTKKGWRRWISKYVRQKHEYRKSIVDIFFCFESYSVDRKDGKDSLQ